MGFTTEKELVATAVSSPCLQNIINENITDTFFELEFKGLFGIPDLVVATTQEKPRTYAFEMKLANWKRALAQAYRYRAFADVAYVMMDDDYVGPAIANLAKFIKSNVGLLSIKPCGDILVHHQPEEAAPYCEYLAATMRNRIETCCC